MVYLIGSLRHERVRTVAAELRAHQIEVFEDWHAAGKDADEIWQRYEQERGHTFREALRGKCAQNTWAYDKRNLDAASTGVLVMPAGKSGHLELGYLIGQGKPGYILLEQEPERWDVMYAFAAEVLYDMCELVHRIAVVGGYENEYLPRRPDAWHPGVQLPSLPRDGQAVARQRV